MCTGPLRLSISFAGEATGTLQVSYTYLHLLTFAVIPPVPAGFEFLDLHGRYRWKLQRNAPIVNLRISVTAPDGSCTIHQPEVFVCDCSNKGTCDFNKTTANLQSRVKVATCLCPEAYSGQYCEEDRDACKAAFQPCFSGVDCIDRTAPQIGYACGGCPMGFNGSGDSCYGKQLHRSHCHTIEHKPDLDVAWLHIECRTSCSHSRNGVLWLSLASC